MTSPSCRAGRSVNQKRCAPGGDLGVRNPGRRAALCPSELCARAPPGAHLPRRGQSSGSREHVSCPPPGRFRVPSSRRILIHSEQSWAVCLPPVTAPSPGDSPGCQPAVLSRCTSAHQAQGAGLSTAPADAEMAVLLRRSAQSRSRLQALPLIAGDLEGPGEDPSTRP